MQKIYSPNLGSETGFLLIKWLIFTLKFLALLQCNFSYPELKRRTDWKGATGGLTEKVWIQQKQNSEQDGCGNRNLLVTMEMRETSLVPRMLKNLPAMQETWVQSLGWEDLLEKEMASHSSILAWRIPQTKSGGLWSTGSQRVVHNWATNTHRNWELFHSGWNWTLISVTLFHCNLGNTFQQFYNEF